MVLSWDNGWDGMTMTPPPPDSSGSHHLHIFGRGGAKDINDADADAKDKGFFYADVSHLVKG